MINEAMHVYCQQSRSIPRHFYLCSSSHFHSHSMFVRRGPKIIIWQVGFFALVNLVLAKLAPGSRPLECVVTHTPESHPHAYCLHTCTTPVQLAVQLRHLSQDLFSISHFLVTNPPFLFVLFLLSCQRLTVASTWSQPPCFMRSCRIFSP